MSQSSYNQILKSSSVIGGVKAAGYLVNIVSVKVVALLLGPTGVGLIGMYTVTIGMLSTLAGLGIASSGVRQVASSNGSGNPQEVAATVQTLRRICWLTGSVGWLLSAVCSIPLSKWIFGSTDHAWAIAILGSTILFGAISGGQSALLQGMRKIGDLARIQVFSTVLGAFATIVIYYFLGINGVVPVLIALSLFQLLVTWLFARRIEFQHVALSWQETFSRSKVLVTLGIALMWTGLLASIVTLLIRWIILRELGLSASGIYQATWAISGMFAGFILGAMGADFYPRLAEVSQDNTRINQLVNEQTEIGILLALPGLVATLAFAPWLMQLFFSKEFLQGANLLPWFVLGVYGQVLSWPLGFTLIAKGAKSSYAFIETVANVVKFLASYGFLLLFGLVGTAIAYPVTYVFYTMSILLIVSKLTGFYWSRPVIQMLAISSFYVAASFVLTTLFVGIWATFLGALLVSAASIYCFRGLEQRIGRSHKLIRTALKVPGVRLILSN